MMNRWKVGLGAALLVSSIGTVPAAATRDDASKGASRTQASLRTDGYTCEVVSVGFSECTASGKTTYWCDSGSCQPKPKTWKRSGEIGPRLPRDNSRGS